MKYEHSDQKYRRRLDLKTILLSLLFYSCSSFMIADFSTGNSILDIYQNGFSYIFRQTKSECAMHINASHIPVVLLCHKMSFRESESVK